MKSEEVFKKWKNNGGACVSRRNKFRSGTTSFPTTTSNHGSNHGSRSGSSDGNKHDRSTNEDAAADVETADGPRRSSNGRAFAERNF